VQETPASLLRAQLSWAKSHEAKHKQQGSNSNSSQQKPAAASAGGNISQQKTTLLGEIQLLAPC